jgi:hypothetical protein
VNDKFRPQAPKPRRNHGGRAWLTLGTVAAYAAVSITRSVPAWAQDTSTSVGKGLPQAQQGPTVRRLDIPATSGSRDWQSATLRLSPGARTERHCGPRRWRPAAEARTGDDQPEIHGSNPSRTLRRHDPGAAVAQLGALLAHRRSGWVVGRDTRLHHCLRAIALSLTGIAQSYDRLQRWRRLSNSQVARSLVSR